MNIANLSLIAGSKWQWTESFSSFPAADYTACVKLKKETAAAITINAVSTDIYTFTKPSSETAGLAPGRYFYQFIFNDGSDDYILREYSGTVDILPNIAETASDMRTADEKALAYLEEQFSKLSQKEVASISANGRTYTYNDLEKVYALILKLRYRIGEKAAKNKGYTRKKLVVFNKTF